MGKSEKLILKLLSGLSDTNFSFNELCTILIRIGFKERIKGSHHIFCKNEVSEIVNIQSKDGKAKAYQIKQVRNIIVKYKLVNDENKI